MIVIAILGFIIFSAFSTFLAITLPRRRGRAGENKVSRLLKKLPYIQYRVVNDVLLKTSHETTQII